MNDHIYAIAVSANFAHLRNFYEWTRQHRIPVLDCRVRVWNFDSYPYDMQGSSRQLNLYGDESLDRRTGYTNIRTNLIFRNEIDFTLAALFHGGMKRGWRSLVTENMGYANESNGS